MIWVFRSLRRPIPGGLFSIAMESVLRQAYPGWHWFSSIDADWADYRLLPERFAGKITRVLSTEK